jgi:hypothetical protein
MSNQRDKAKWQFTLPRLIAAEVLFSIASVFIAYCIHNADTNDKGIALQAALARLPAAVFGGAGLGVVAAGMRGAWASAFVGFVVAFASITG